MSKWMWRLYWAGVMLTFSVALVILSGCKSQPGVEPVLTPAEIMTTPDETKRNPCTKKENLPKCDGYYVITYTSRVGGCIWNARCVRSF